MKGLTGDELELISEIFRLDIYLVLSDEIENQPFNTANQKKIKKVKHQEWHAHSKKLKTSMCQYIDRNVISYTPSSIPSNSDVPRY